MIELKTPRQLTAERQLAEKEAILSRVALNIKTTLEGRYVGRLLACPTYASRAEWGLVKTDVYKWLGNSNWVVSVECEDAGMVELHIEPFRRMAETHDA